MKILMVCLGNICRSPIAEGLMQKMSEAANLEWEVASAGTNGYHTGEAPHRFSQKVCLKNGIDISHQRAARFKLRDFDEYDRIYVMAQDVYDDVKKMARNEKDMEKVAYFLSSLNLGNQKDVPDPWYGEEDGYEPVYELIKQACTAIIKDYEISIGKNPEK